MIYNNVDLSQYSRFKSGGVAENFFEPNEQDELIFFLKKDILKKPINVIGAGSNLLIMDGLIKGTIISTKKLNKVYIYDKKIIAESGTLNSKIFNIAKNNKIKNFEFLACIPGTIGGACKMNAGCYNWELKDIMTNLKAVDFKGNIKNFSIDDCMMEYRKNNLQNDLIYLEIEMNANQKSTKEEIENIFNEMLIKKINSQPLSENTCGSTFKNFSKDLPAWKIIKEIGLQNIDFNGVKFSEKHANFLINSNASSTDIKKLIDITIKKAREKFKIDMELEIKIIGNNND